MRIRKMFLSTLAAIVILCPLTFVQAADQSANDPQSMPQLMPQQIVMYLQWPGRDQAEELFEDTEFSRLWAEPQMKHFSNTWHEKTWPSIKKVIFENIPDKPANVANEFLPVLYAAYEYPSAFSLISAEMGAMGPMADLALVIQAGEKADELQEQFEKALAATGMGMATDPSRQIKAQGTTFKQLSIMPSLPVRWGILNDKLNLPVTSWKRNQNH